MNRQGNRAKRYHDAICRILLHEWDPIGVADIPEARNEYDMYADGVAGILMRGQPKEKLIEYLWTVETGNMGLSGDRNRLDSIADQLLRLRGEIDDDA